MEEFRDLLLKYLLSEQALAKKEIEQLQTMSHAEKIEKGLLIPHASVTNQNDSCYELSVPDNNSKLRAGDRILIKDEKEISSWQAKVLDVFYDCLTIECEAQLSKDQIYIIESVSPELLQSLIACLEGMYAGVPGVSFLRLLAGEISMQTEEFLKIELDEIPRFNKFTERMNSDQICAVQKMLEYPPVHVLQGPPGTGKTQVLAATAIATARMNREVVVIANTHHAVNNALQKIHNMDSNTIVVKIGEKLKADELDDEIFKFEKFKDYADYSYTNRRKKKSGHVVGMTIWGAIVHLGLRRHSHFRPYISLVDEASLLPLSIASILGKTAPSVVLFGDSYQMQPIFRNELVHNKFSISILDYCAQNVRGVDTSILHTSYRMNDYITKVVSKNFYEPHGIQLFSSDFSKNRELNLPCFEKMNLTGPFVNIILHNDEEPCDDCNPAEARYVANLLKSILSEGVPAKEVAVISPFRKQVKALRDAVRETLGEQPELLIDTVERLQGQDVDCIVISFASSSLGFIDNMNDFIFNPNRLNVMISRAKKKVILVSSDTLAEKLSEIIHFYI